MIMARQLEIYLISGNKHYRRNVALNKSFFEMTFTKGYFEGNFSISQTFSCKIHKVQKEQLVHGTDHQ